MHQLKNSNDGAITINNSNKAYAQSNVSVNKRPSTQKEVSWKLLVQIFISFFKIGPVTFGGGYAMIPLIEKEVVTNRKWVKTSDITDVFAVAESVPGAIAINSSTFIGYRLAGVRGAIAAMTGVLLPTFFIVVMLSIFFLSVQGHPKIEAAFTGIRPAIVALITYAGYKIGLTAVLDKTTFGIVIATVAVLYISHFHPVVIILSGAFLGILIVQIRNLLGMKTKFEKENLENKYKYEDYFIGDGI